MIIIWQDSAWIPDQESLVLPAYRRTSASVCDEEHTFRLRDDQSKRNDAAEGTDEDIPQ